MTDLPPAPEGRIIGWAHTRFGKSDAQDVEALMAEAS